LVFFEKTFDLLLKTNGRTSWLGRTQGSGDACHSRFGTKRVQNVNNVLPCVVQKMMADFAVMNQKIVNAKSKG